MQHISRQTIQALVFAFVAMLASGTALAEKPSWAGDKPGKHQQDREGSPAQKHDAGGTNVSVHFNSDQRAVIRNYFDRQARAGNCPRGLAKKNNGCLPPGQAKKWAIGQPLPHDVTVYNLPRRVAEQLGTPPAGHRYVRVAADILLIAVGTSMVVDAIEDLGKM